MYRFWTLLLGVVMSVNLQASESGLKPREGEAVLVLGGGCFWCLEAVYEELRGVREAVSGYAGGHIDHPSYKQVVGGDTGHAEVVAVYYDPTVLELAKLLDVFYAIHDPTTPNRQGNDVGPQYRSIAFHANDAEKEAIDAAIERAKERWPGRIVTEVEALPTFYVAEDYHQQYFELNGSQPYCSLVIAPKIAKFRKEFAALRK
jgi:peptide-methionine (S)-S-oxide reductase